MKRLDTIEFYRNPLPQLDTIKILINTQKMLSRAWSLPLLRYIRTTFRRGVGKRLKNVRLGVLETEENATNRAR